MENSFKCYTTDCKQIIIKVKIQFISNKQIEDGISLGCSNKVPYTGWLITIEIYFLEFWKLEVVNQDASMLGSGQQGPFWAAD